jgi:Fe-S-cluster containining protein
MSLIFPDTCKACGGKCCLHPHVMEKEYQRMVRILGVARTNGHRPVQLKPGWWKFQKSCPALGPDGCRLPPGDRPMTCQLYPFEAIHYKDDKWRILLDVSLCPRWDLWGSHYQEAVQTFKACMERPE